MRKEVLCFAEEMEDVLKENDYKDGWNNCGDDYLHRKLLEEVSEYFLAQGVDPVEVLRDFANEMIGANNEVEDRKSLNNEVDSQHELVDIANICMMLHDNHKG